MRQSLPDTVLVEFGTSQLKLIALAAIASILLRAFYAAFQSRWPEKYFGGDRGVDPVVSRSPIRYASFRIIPLMAMMVVAGVVGSRIGESRTLAIAYTTSLHIVTGPGFGLFQAVQKTPRRLGLAIYRLATILSGILVAFTVIAIGGRLDTFVPDGHELANSVWIGVAVLALAQLALSMTAPPIAPGALVARARNSIDPALLRKLRENANGHAAAFEAVALAECLNRPRWVRRLESLLLRQSGTYGLMQMHSTKPISDDESVDRFLTVAQNHPTLLSIDEAAYDTPREFFLAHNDDGSWADLATELYWHILQERSAGQEAENQNSNDARLEADTGGRRVKSTAPPLAWGVLGCGIGLSIAKITMRRRGVA